MTDVLNSLFESTQAMGIIPESDHNTHIIAESIILDRVHGNKESLAKVLAEAGQYAVRDNLLEDAQLVDVCTVAAAPCVTKPCDFTAVLATAKEANDPNYATYCKAYALIKKLTNDMCDKYRATADERVAEVNKAIDSNPRLVNAIDTVNDACCK